jgi:heptosyltransferase-1
MKIERLLIVRLGSLGDVIHAIPAVVLLRQAFPAAEIHWAIEERWKELIEGRDAGERPLVDILHFVNTRTWRRALLSDETWREVFTSVSRLRQVRFDAAVDFQGLLKSAIVATASGARTRYGFDKPREQVAALFYTRRIRPSTAHVVDQNIELARLLAPETDGLSHFRLPHDPAAEGWCQRELRRRNVNAFALLSPGGGWAGKLWPAEKFVDVACALGREGLPSVINYGPGEDALATLIERASGGVATALPCSLAELIALMRRATVFVGGDTGPMHLAAALGVPLVALFGPTDPIRNGPYGTKSIVLRSPQSKTSYSHTSRADDELVSIASSEVINAVHRLLDNKA